MFEQPYQKLKVVEKADDFILAVYQETKSFPSEEKFGITSQLRRAATSIALNIVEGQARGSTKDYIRFLVQARGSSAECGYILGLSVKLGYLTDGKYRILENKRREAGFLLQKMITGLKNK